MLTDQKILVTGASGMVGQPIVQFLAAANNDVWAAARFAAEGARAKVEAMGATPVDVDLDAGDLGALPQDFDYVLHLAYFRGGANDFDRAMRINGEGLGLVLQHCRSAKAALVMSGHGVYAPNADPYRPAHEDDAIGGTMTPWAPTASSSKVAQEAVARFCARAFNLPITIARLNTVYGPFDRMLPISQMDSVMAGREVVHNADPAVHTPIHVDDICRQIEPMLAAASVPATIVNWAGDEQISAQDWCRMVGEWSGRGAKLGLKPIPGATAGPVADITRRQAITGPCQVRFADGYRALFEQRYPEFAGKA
jgi:nucleoside-diphosphate-sugar epimerase